ncbi:MAG: hypothetical protein HC850_05875, partial [Rhodomicrobium sp.]|nr:hypothetical protein [Rhodomicrobium sp.]
MTETLFVEQRRLWPVWLAVAFGTGVAYASKAFLCAAMARLADEEGMHIDVASSGEAFVALRAGVPADRLVFHGNNKSTAELTYALEHRFGRIVIDVLRRARTASAPRELRASASEGPAPAYARRRGAHPRVHLDGPRGREVRLLDQERRGHGSGPEVPRDDSGVELVGVHAHVGSQVFATSSFERIVEVLAAFFQPLGLPELVIGGGLGVAYLNAETAPSISEWGAIVRDAAEKAGLSS